MSHPFPSEAWTQAFAEAVEANPDYREAGRDWTHGKVAMVVEPDPARGIEKEVGMVLDVHEGHCRGARYVQDGDNDDAAFVIRASFDVWREVIEGGLDPTQAMMMGKLQLTRGHLPTMIKYVESSKQLVLSARRVPTQWPA